MHGLQNNNENILQKLEKLFFQKKTTIDIFSKKHWNILKNIPIPDINHEQWKYISLQNLFSYKFILPEIYNIPNTHYINKILNINACKLLFINGKIIYPINEYDINIWKINIIKNNDSKFQIYPPIDKNDFFLYLIETFSQEIINISLRKNSIPKRPLYLIFINFGLNNKTLNFINYRLNINIENNSQVEIIEHYININKYPYFNGTRTTFDIQNNSYVKYLTLLFENTNCYHFTNNDIHIGKNSNIEHNNIMLGSKLTRYQTNAKINGINSNIFLNSLLLPFNNNIHNNRTYIEHNQEKGFSRQTHKIINKNKGKGIFYGLIKVNKFGINSNGKINNHALLLDPLSSIYSKPHLEIYTNNIKCSHSATLGYINKELIFYFRSRGIDCLKSQIILINAFCNEIINNIQITNKNIQKIINKYVKKHIKENMI